MFYTPLVPLEPKWMLAADPSQNQLPYSGKVWRAEFLANLAFGGKKFGE